MSFLTSSVVDKNELGVEKIEEMFNLYANYFEATNRRLFQNDLANKQWVILLHDGDGILRGFSTITLSQFTYGLSRGRVIFSGDTIIHHDYWGNQSLSREFIAHAGRLKASFPDETLYWLLISKGYRTYRYLPVGFREFYPRLNIPTPPNVKKIIDHLAFQKFGDAYDADAGVVRFPQSRGQLRGAWADIPESMRLKPEVRFFLERNPGYREGHELVCLVEVSPENLRGFGRRTYLQASNALTPAL